jgi:hypothetical protein
MGPRTSRGRGWKKGGDEPGWVISSGERSEGEAALGCPDS